MTIDMCALTADVLPLYAEDLLSPETRRLLEEHIAECPDCRQRLQAATVVLTPPAWVESSTDKPARRFFGRLRRILHYGVVALVVLVLTAGGLGYRVGHRSTWELEAIPAHVTGAEEVALRAIPGWGRAEAQGLVVDLGITDKIPGTQASITLEKAWFSERQSYILYTVKAPAGEYVAPTRVWLGPEGSGTPFTEGQTEWHRLSQWGGFSPEGFHSVMAFPRLSVPQGVGRLKLTYKLWSPVTPEEGLQTKDTGLAKNRSVARELSLQLPWRAANLQEPAPQVLPWTQRHTWMGRTLALEQLQVGIGQMTLTGHIELPQGERNPTLIARLQVGGKVLGSKQFRAEPAGAPGAYRFTAVYDGPDRWPAPVKLEVYGIDFDTDKVLEWPVNWAKYRERDSSDHRLMDPADQVSVRFYDSDLISILAYRGGVAIERKEPKGPAPYVRAAFSGGGRGQAPFLHAGFEVRTEQGDVLTNMGGGAGVIYDKRQGVSADWRESLPETFRKADRLMLRYVDPSATLVVEETWEMPPVK